MKCVCGISSTHHSILSGHTWQMRLQVQESSHMLRRKDRRCTKMLLHQSNRSTPIPSNSRTFRSLLALKHLTFRHTAKLCSSFRIGTSRNEKNLGETVLFSAPRFREGIRFRSRLPHARPPSFTSHPSNGSSSLNTCVRFITRRSVSGNGSRRCMVGRLSHMTRSPTCQ